MITPDLLKEHFYPVLELGGGLVRADDELPKKVFHTYVLTGSANPPFTTSENLIDDDLAAQVLAAGGGETPASLEKVAMGANAHGFTHVLRVPADFHSELKGRLDKERQGSTLCIPIYESEFSGTETKEEFTALRRLAPTQDWARKPAPKITLRFDNPKTGGGTVGGGYVPAQFDQLTREIEALVGSKDGFIEVLNFKGEVVELLFEDGHTFRWIEARNDAAARMVPMSDLPPLLVNFLG